MSLDYVSRAEYDYLLKLLIVGDSGVGKTSILQRFATDYFKDDYVATVGVDFHIRTIDVDGHRCKLQVWDTAGQDRFRCVVSTFYRGAHGAMICFDITDKDSFQNVQTWLDAIYTSCPEDTPVFLVGTKSDLQYKRVIPYTIAKAYADKNRLVYLETSAKTNENILICFEDFTRSIVAHKNQMKLNTKEKATEGIKIDLNSETKPITTSESCFGGFKCTI
ncbi:unnamed protein product [Adineta ricciae]|uniref:Uncharacterized protein n=1 Tax=Adineta ricciae TaxID=249248 RepID=A0A814WM88_ADIRI|nr:unnamed protein product [Adineta ricciae]